MSDTVKSSAFEKALKTLTSVPTYSTRGAVKKIGAEGGFNSQNILQQLCACCGSSLFGAKTYNAHIRRPGHLEEKASFLTSKIIVYKVLTKDEKVELPEGVESIRLPQSEFDLLIKWEDI